jgi:hypothetical protein
MFYSIETPKVIYNPLFTVIIGSIIIFITARKVIELAKQPPPVFAGVGTEAPGMRWVDRNDPFLTTQERRYPNV